ncbi:MAG TPA: glycosyltransferase family 4 protein, partial [Thermoplasmata archaeon]|nr:glycosyltransferase family 4 protein [Thermoplasmata archaeon]
RDALLREGVPLDSFSFLGYLPYDRLPALYARAAVYLLPTLYENVPLRMLEAMSSGAPVVASDVGGIPEVIVSYENGILVPPRNSEALASAMLQLLDDPSLAARLGRAGRATVHDAYNWNRVAELTAGSYRRMLNGEVGDA